MIHVTNEIGKLKKVLLHRPGGELSNLVPDDLERLLFDDIPDLPRAQEEHDAFAELLRAEGVEVIYLDDLAAEALDTGEVVRSAFIEEFLEEGLQECASAGAKAANRFAQIRQDMAQYLQSIKDPKQLIQTTMFGVTTEEAKRTIGLRKDWFTGEDESGQAHFRMAADRFVLDPIPNLYFTRDPFAFVGNGATLHRMYSPTRRRETLYGEYILKHHPDFAIGSKARLYYDRTFPHRLEGGDVMNLSKKTLIVGLSQRTSMEGAALLAKQLFADKDNTTETVLALQIPNARAYMHLDTVMTQIDIDRFLIHPGILHDLRIFEIRRADDDLPGSGAGDRRSIVQAEGSALVDCREDGKRNACEEGLHICEIHESLEEVLARHLQVPKVQLLYCGDGDRVAAEREQWSDGSNTLCICPGTVIVYDRNRITNELLRREGIRVIEMPGSELARGRGGPHCMSMPIQRDDIM